MVAKIIPPKGYTQGQGMARFSSGSGRVGSKKLGDLTYIDFFGNSPLVCASSVLNCFDTRFREVREAEDPHYRVAASDFLRNSARDSFKCYDSSSYALTPFFDRAKKVLEEKLSQEGNPFNLSLSELSFSLQR